MDALAALADPTRRRIVELLARGERSAGELVDEFDVSAPAISQHLKALREAGLAEIDAWLERVRAFWSPRLDALERELRKPTRRKR